jgi:hypothetical protein
MLNHLAPVAVPQPKLPETRQPTGTLANHGLTSVDLAILSGATLQEGPPRNLSQSHGITTLFRRIVSFFLPCFAFGYVPVLSSLYCQESPSVFFLLCPSSVYTVHLTQDLAHQFTFSLHITLYHNEILSMDRQRNGDFVESHRLVPY